MKKAWKWSLVLGAGLMAMSAPALAAKETSAQGSALSGQALSPAATATTLVTIDLNVSGRISFDGLGAEGNDVVLINIAPGAEVLGLGWNVSMTGIDPSYVSEMAIGFGSSSTGFVNLRPGISQASPGSGTFSSNGIIDLVTAGFNFNVEDDGVLRLEFFETFDDTAGAIDGTWDGGTITLQVSAVPEPTTYGMMALGLLGVAAAARRRRSA